MKRKIILLVIVSGFILAGSTRCFGQTTSKEIIDKFFELYATDAMKAIDYAFSTNKWMDSRKPDIENMKQKFKGIIDSSGQYFGYEALAERVAGESIKLISYYLKYDREPLRVTFFLYKAKDKWMVHNFSYDVNMNDDLSQAAKFFWLKENH